MLRLPPSKHARRGALPGPHGQRPYRSEPGGRRALPSSIAADLDASGLVLRLPNRLFDGEAACLRGENPDRSLAASRRLLRVRRLPGRPRRPDSGGPPRPGGALLRLLPETGASFWPSPASWRSRTPHGGASISVARRPGFETIVAGVPFLVFPAASPHRPGLRHPVLRLPGPAPPERPRVPEQGLHPAAYKVARATPCRGAVRTGGEFRRHDRILAVQVPEPRHGESAYVKERSSRSTWRRVPCRSGRDARGWRRGRMPPA